MKKGNNMAGLISMKKFAEEYVHRPESTIRTWKRQGKLPEYLFKKTGRTVSVREHRIQEWIDSDD